MLNDMLDCALVPEDCELPDRLNRWHLYADKAVAVLPAAHRLAGQNLVTAQDLREETLLFSDRCGGFAVRLNTVVPYSFRLQRCNGAAAQIMDLVNAGLGVALLSDRLTIAPPLATRPFEEPELKRPGGGYLRQALPGADFRLTIKYRNNALTALAKCAAAALILLATSMMMGSKMKAYTFFSAALFGAVVLSAAPAFAERWVEPVNGTVSAVPMQDGSVMMRITIPAKPYGMISRDMREGHMNCQAKQADVNSKDSLIVVCGAN